MVAQKELHRGGWLGGSGGKVPAVNPGDLWGLSSRK